LCCIVLHCFCCIVLHCLYCIVLHCCVVLYCTVCVVLCYNVCVVLCCTVCVVLYCTVCIVLHCLYCIVLFFCLDFNHCIFLYTVSNCTVIISATLARQAICKQYNYCCVKAISITHSGRVSVPLFNQHAPLYTANCGLPALSVCLSPYLINGTIFEKQELDTKCVF
jgi:hypothetical protein